MTLSGRPPVRSGHAAVALLAISLAGGCGKREKDESRTEGARGEPAARGQGTKTPALAAAKRGQVVVVDCIARTLAASGDQAGDDGVRKAGCTPGAGTPRVRIGRSTVAGPMDKALVRRYLRAKMPVLMECYQKRLEDDPELQGTVTTYFTIGTDGRAGNAIVKGMDDEVAACAKEIVESTEFAKPRGGGLVKVRYPFLFHPCTVARPGASVAQPDAAPASASGDRVARSLRANLEPLRACYRKGLEEDAALAVKMRLDIAIDSKGRVADARSPDAPASPAAGALQTCVADAVEHLVLPASASGPRQVRCALSFGVPTD